MLVLGYSLEERVQAIAGLTSSLGRSLTLGGGLSGAKASRSGEGYSCCSLRLMLAAAVALESNSKRRPSEIPMDSTSNFTYVAMIHL